MRADEGPFDDFRRSQKGSKTFRTRMFTRHSGFLLPQTGSTTLVAQEMQHSQCGKKWVFSAITRFQ